MRAKLPACPLTNLQMPFQQSRNRLPLVKLSLILLVLTPLAGCKSDYPSSGKAASPDSKSAPRQVKTAKAAEMPIGETVTVNGSLAAYDRVTVSTKVPGRLQTISVDLGSTVRKGQILAQLEQQDYKLRVQQAEAALAQARAAGIVTRRWR